MDGIWRESKGGTAGELTALPAKIVLADGGSRGGADMVWAHLLAAHEGYLHETNAPSKVSPQQARIATDFAFSLPLTVSTSSP